MFFRGRKGKEEEIEDDGRSFADMNVEGMPWYRPKQECDNTSDEKLNLTRSEYKSFVWGVLKAAFLVGFVFVGVYFLFILFLDVIVFGN